MFRVITGNELFPANCDANEDMINNNIISSLSNNSLFNLETNESNLITSLLNSDVNERFTLDQVKKHEYFNGINFE